MAKYRKYSKGLDDGHYDVSDDDDPGDDIGYGDDDPKHGDSENSPDPPYTVSAVGPTPRYMLEPDHTISTAHVHVG